MPWSRRLLGLLSLAMLSSVACRNFERRPKEVDRSPRGIPTEAPETAASLTEPAPPPVTSRSAPAPAPTPSHDVEYSIVWGRVAGGPAESFLLEWRPAELKVLAKRSGAHFFADGGVYRWTQTSGKAETFIDCDEAWNPPEKPNRRNRARVPVKGANLVRLDASQEIVVSALPAPEQASRYENEVTLQASMGSYVFFDERAQETYCTAMHASWSYSPRVYDLATRIFVEVTKEDEQYLRAQAQTKSTPACAEAVRLAQALGDQSPSGGLAQMGFESVRPTWSTERGLGFLVGFTAMESYAAGKHDCQVEVPDSPPSFASFVLPHSLALISKEKPQLQVQGWSIVPTDDSAILERVLKAFRSSREQPSRK